VNATFESMPRHIALYQARREPYAICDGKMFRRDRGMIRPYGPIAADYSLSAAAAHSLLDRLRGRLIRTTDGFRRIDEPSPWYAVVCKAFQPLSAMKAKQRSEIRRGLRLCEVRRVDTPYLAENGYTVFRRAFERYTNIRGPVWTEPQFRRHLLDAREFDDIVHCWAVFRAQQLVAFGINNVFDRIEATYWLIKLDPDHLDAYPAYALLYTMNRYYLEENDFQYVNDGWRALLHPTRIQEFLIKKFNFCKAYCRLTVHYKPWLALALHMTYPLRGMLGRLDPRVKALYALESVRRGCRAN